MRVKHEICACQHQRPSASGNVSGFDVPTPVTLKTPDAAQANMSWQIIEVLVWFYCSCKLSPSQVQGRITLIILINFHDPLLSPLQYSKVLLTYSWNSGSWDQWILSVPLTHTPPPAMGNHLLQKHCEYLHLLTFTQHLNILLKNTECHRETDPRLQNRARAAHIKQSSQLCFEQGGSKASQNTFSFTKLCLKQHIWKMQVLRGGKKQLRLRHQSIHPRSQIKDCQWSEEESRFKLLCSVKPALWRCFPCMQRHHNEPSLRILTTWDVLSVLSYVLKDFKG